jgi:hypothetical protein
MVEMEYQMVCKFKPARLRYALACAGGLGDCQPVSSRHRQRAAGCGCTAASTRELLVLRISDLCVANGTVIESPGVGFKVEAQAMRAVVPAAVFQKIEARFLYRGCVRA